MRGNISPPQKRSVAPPLFTEKECGSYPQRREALSRIHREGVWLLTKEKRDTLSSSWRRSTDPLLQRRDRQYLLFAKKECGSRLHERETPSQIHRDGVWFLYTEKRGALLTSLRRSVAPLHKEERHSLLFTKKECGSFLQRRETLHRE